MTGIAANIGLGILTNVIYDIIKYIGNRFDNNNGIVKKCAVEKIP